MTGSSSNIWRGGYSTAQFETSTPRDDQRQQHSRRFEVSGVVHLSVMWISFCGSSIGPVNWNPIRVESITVVALGILFVILGHVYRSVWGRLTLLRCITYCLIMGFVGGGIAETKREDLNVQKSLGFPYLLEKKSFVSGEVIRIEPRGYILRIGHIISPTSDQRELHLSSAIMMWVWGKEKDRSDLREGDQVWWSGEIRAPREAPSPWALDETTWAEQKGISVIGSGVTLLRLRPYTLISGLRSIRALLSNQLSREGSAYALIRGLTLGDSSELPPMLRRNLQRMGLSHLLAVSGLHVGMIALIFGWIALRIGFLVGSFRLWRWRVMGSMLSAWLYVFLAGESTSAQRAAVMLSCWCFSRWFLFSIPAEITVLSAGWYLVSSDPLAGLGISLQLSLAATLGLCLAAEPSPALSILRMKEHRDQSKLIHSLWRGIRLAMRVSWVAWLVTTPILIWHTGEISLMSPLMNLLITPLISITILPCVILSGLLSPLWADPMNWLASGLQPVLDGMQNLNPKLFPMVIVGRYACVPWSMIALSWILSSRARWYDPLHQSARLLFDPQALLLCPMIDPLSHRRHQRLCNGVSILLLFSSLLFQTDHHSIEEPRVRFLWVGQGDATLIQGENGRFALFDAGPPHAASKLVMSLKRMGVKRLEWVAVSHLHPDHYGGLETLLDEIKIDLVITHGRRTEREHPWRVVENALAQHQIPIIHARREVYHWAGLALDWLLAKPKQALKENDASLALLIKRETDQGEGSTYQVLLSGDLEKLGETELRRAWLDKENKETLFRVEQLPLTIWQLDHHGSLTSTDPQSLKVIKPKLAVISADGKHRFGLPHPLTLNRLAVADVPWVRLDIVGDFEIILSFNSGR